ncbi:MAG TPA: Lrp/AsnC ligand binding domain-containing protein [Nitrososphaera sp.]|nr:Lrp/AsnC ligand binding domain-containing protein [Nitrososphaera sp.]
MSRAFVLLNCDIGTENAIISTISGMSGVSEAIGLSGVYDIIAKLNAETENGISKIVTKIRSIASIRSSLTMIIADGQND